MSVPFSFKAQRNSSSPEFSEAASFLKRPFGGAEVAVSSQTWGIENERTEGDSGSLPAERLFRPGHGEPKPIAPRPRSGALAGLVSPVVTPVPPAVPLSGPDHPRDAKAGLLNQAVTPALAFGKSPAPRDVKADPIVTAPVPKESPASPEPLVASPFSKPTAQAPEPPPSGAPASSGCALPATAGEGWRAAELAVAHREIARLKAREADLLRRMEALEGRLTDLISNPPAPDHRKVMGMVDEWMNGHIDGVVEAAVRRLFGQDREDAEDASEPWFRRKPLVSMTAPESGSPPFPSTNPTRP